MAWLRVPGRGLFLVAKVRLDARFMRVRLPLGGLDAWVVAGLRVDHPL